MATFPPIVTILHARRVRWIKQFLRTDGCFELTGENAWFNNGDGVGKVDFLDAIHAHKRERNPAARRHAPAHVTKSPSARGDRNFLARGELKKLAHISCRFCKDDNFRRMCCEPFITAVRSDRFRIVRDNFVVEDLSEL